MTLVARLRQLFIRLRNVWQSPSNTNIATMVLVEQHIAAVKAGIRERMPKNPVLQGYRIYSQADEDGILNEIFRRVGVGQRVFLEIGCGRGIENNTHALILNGWRGTWIDGDPGNIEWIGQQVPLRSPRLTVLQAFVTVDNVAGLVSEAAGRFGVDQLDLLSLDIDGNDVHVIERVAQQFKPRVIMLEYNGRFPPPLSVAIKRNDGHAWASDDYFGGSLQAFVNVLPEYRLVACNLAGTNAFFVRSELAGDFDDYAVESLYQPTRFHLVNYHVGETGSMKFLRDTLAQ